MYFKAAPDISFLISGEGTCSLRRRYQEDFFLSRSAGLGAGFYLFPLGLSDSANASELPAPGTFDKSLGFFTEEERATLGLLCDGVFPEASSLGVVYYIETLLTAFDSNPPKIYAGGPYSGRNPFSKTGIPTKEFPKNSFVEFLPLNRVQEATWRLKIYGSRSIPGGYWNEKVAGVVIGLRDLIKTGIQNALTGADKTPDWGRTSSQFQKAVTALVVEGCFAAPEYGGNQSSQGWKLANFSGDSLPLGYSLFDESTQTYKERSDSPVSTFDENEPEKMGLVTRTFCSIITVFRGGRVYR